MAGRIFLYIPRNWNRGGAPSRGGAKISEPPLHRAPTSGNLALEMSSLERASFGRKRNFLANFSPAPRKFGALWTPGTIRRKLLMLVGKAAVKISVMPITSVEFIVRENQ